AIASEQATVWPLANLGRVVWGMFQAVVTYKRPAVAVLAFTSTAPADAMEDILAIVVPEMVEMRNRAIDNTWNDSTWGKVISSGPFSAEWDLIRGGAFSDFDVVEPAASSIEYQTLVGKYNKYQAVKFYIRSLYARNGVHVSNEDVNGMLSNLFAKRTWEMIGSPENVQRIASGTSVDFDIVFSSAVNEASSEIFGLGKETYRYRFTRTAGTKVYSADSSWDSLKQVDSEMYGRLERLLGKVSEVRTATLNKVAAQSLRNLLQSQPLLSPDPLVQNSPTAATQLRKFFYQLNESTPILDKEQGAYLLPKQPGLKEIFFRSQGNVLNPSSNVPGVDLPASVKSVLLSSLREAAANGYFDADPSTRLTPGNGVLVDMSGRGIIDAPEVLFSRLVKLLDPEVYYNSVGVEFSADLPRPDGTRVTQTIGDLRAIQFPEEGGAARIADQHARGKAAAQEVIRLTGSEEAAYRLLSKGRSEATSGSVALKYSQQFLIDAYQEVYKGVLERYLQANPTPDGETMQSLVRGLVRMTNSGGIQAVGTQTGEDQLSNIFLRGTQSDGYGTPKDGSLNLMKRLVDVNFDAANPQGFKNGLAGAFTKAVRSVIFADQARKLDVLMDAYALDLASDYANNVASARRSGSSSVTAAKAFYKTAIESAYSQTLSQSLVGEAFFEQCKAFGLVPADFSLESMTVFELRSRLLAASQGRDPDQAVKPSVRTNLINASVRRALNTLASNFDSTIAPDQPQLPKSRSFYLAVLGARTELTPEQRTLGQRILAESKSNNVQDLTEAAYALLGVADDPTLEIPQGVQDAVQYAVLEEGGNALHGQRLRSFSRTAAAPDVETVSSYSLVGGATYGSTPGAPGVSDTYADPFDVLRQTAAGAGVSRRRESVYADIRRPTSANPNLIKRIAAEFFSHTQRNRVTLGQEDFTSMRELFDAVRTMVRTRNIALANGEADIQQIVNEYLAKTDDFNRLRLSSREIQSITDPLGEPPQVASGSSTLGSVADDQGYSAVLGARSAEPEPPTGPNPANRFVRGSRDALPEVPDNFQLQRDAQLRRAVTMELIATESRSQTPIPTESRSPSPIPTESRSSSPTPTPRNDRNAPLLSARIVSPEQNIPELMRLSLSTWINDSYTDRAAHVSEFLGSQGLATTPDYVSQHIDAIDRTMGQLFEVMFTDHNDGITSVQQRVLKDSGFHSTLIGWRAEPGVEWDQVFVKLYEASTGIEETPVRAIFQRKIGVMADRLISKWGASAPSQGNAGEVLTREFAANLKFYGNVELPGYAADVPGSPLGSPPGSPTVDRTRLGQLPVTPEQVETLVRSKSQPMLREGIFETPDVAAGTPIPKSRSMGGGAIPLGAGSADDAASLHTLHDAVNNAVKNPANSPQTVAQVQAEVVNQVDAIYAVVERQGQQLWMDSESQEFKLTARQMAEAYKNNEGFLTQCQGYEALREGIAMYLQEEFGTLQPLTQDLVDAYYKAISTELGELLLGVDAQVLPTSQTPVSVTELGAATLEGLLSIGNAVISGDPKAVSKTIIVELGRLKISAVPATTADGTADPVYDFLGQFIAKVEKLVVTNAMTVPEVLDHLSTYATDLSTEQNGGANFRTLLNELKRIQAHTGYATPEGQLALQKRLLTAFKQLTTDLKLKLTNQTPQQEQRTEQFVQLVEDLSQGLSTA
ncbi:MAG: hypothetical protein ORN29_05925, partial [Rhodoferax sp.]|nr:hypothetical protein [Rhodoferax sp.]